MSIQHRPNRFYDQAKSILEAPNATAKLCRLLGKMERLRERLEAAEKARLLMGDEIYKTRRDNRSMRDAIHATLVQNGLRGWDEVRELDYVTLNYVMREFFYSHHRKEAQRVVKMPVVPPPE